MDVMENPERSRFRLFQADGYSRCPGDEDMSTVEAEDTVQLGLLREKDSLSVERAKELAADWIRNARNLHIVVLANGSHSHYFGRDPFRRPKYLGCA